MPDMMDQDRYVRTLAVPDEDCPICYEPFDTEDHKAVRLACGHWFGFTCINGAIKDSPAPNHCPSCRSVMFLRDGETANEDPEDPEILPTPDEDYVPPFIPPLSFVPSVCDRIRIQANWRWGNFRDMDIENHTLLMQFIWESVYPHTKSLLPVISGGGVPYELWCSIEDGVISHLCQQLWRRESDELEPALRYLEFTLLHRYFHYYNLTDREPIRVLVHLLLLHPGMLSNRTLETDSARLWWKMFLIYCRRYPENDVGRQPRLVPDEDRLTMQHFIAMTAFQTLQADLPEHLERSRKKMCESLWYFLPFNMTNVWGPHPQMEHCVWETLERMLRPLPLVPLTPKFFGAAEEEEAVRRLWRISEIMTISDLAIIRRLARPLGSSRT
ncbi:hypothetical protein BDV95DRAFT_658083 [Massariosphaeria phaeospora]|uniref:RING-type domain-containing protein n=1 Tax=Massariosphaeria phaeospora TaxID=100035 RepID=A0A7C8MPF1_9PLEO|nr:hypothetical protein BDV95DRAFT_658083 [Massariosphaeria phaeospora]